MEKKMKKKMKKRKPSSVSSAGVKAVKKAAKAAKAASKSKAVKKATPPPVPNAAKNTPPPVPKASKAAKAVKKTVDGTKTDNLVLRRKAPSNLLTDGLPKELKPQTKQNVAKNSVEKRKKPTGTVTKTAPKTKPKTKSTSSAKKAAAIGVAGAVGVGISKKSKSKKETPTASESSVEKPKSTVKKASPRNKFNAKAKDPVSKTPRPPAGSTNDAVKKAVSSPKIKKAFPKGVPPKLRASAVEKARQEIARQRKSKIPWEKILESITVLISSHILSRGVSRRR